MRCAQCDRENRAGRRFCAECGAELAASCPKCGFTNEPGDKFCGGCGSGLIGESLPALARSRESHLSERSAERRHLTVMFADLARSTELSSQLDPEDLRDLITRYQEVCRTAVDRFGGHVAQYLGDGVMVYFGYPRAHEQDPRRAALAGLQIIEGLTEMAVHFRERGILELAVRIGIHTGPVVVGEIGTAGREEWLAHGETPNIAARLQSIADPNTVVVSRATYQMIEPYFEFGEAQESQVKGIEKPLETRRVIRPAESKKTTQSSRLVGRRSELEALQKAWSRTRSGEASLLLLRGGPGIGKSRLVEAISESLEDGLILRCFCSQLYQDAPLYAATQLLSALLPVLSDRDEPLDRLVDALGKAGRDSRSRIRQLADVLSIPVSNEQFPPVQITPQRKRNETLAAIADLAVAAATRQPTLLIVEDLHWIDPSSLALLDLLQRKAGGTPLMLLLTARTEFEAPWTASDGLEELRLRPIGQQDCHSLVHEVLGRRQLPFEIVDQIVSKSDGVPLFLQQLATNLLESDALLDQESSLGPGALLNLAVPPTLHDSLMARLDRLGNAKRLAQVGATLGRTFSWELLWAISEEDESDLRAQLSHLVEAGLLKREFDDTGEQFSFTHALLQDAAYDSLLKKTRQQFHRKIVETLLQQFPDVVARSPELMAHHSAAALLLDRAIEYWRKASTKAIQNGSNTEAIQHLRKALEVVVKIERPRERSLLEIELNYALGITLQMTYGFSSEGIEPALDRAHVLCKQETDVPERYRVLHSLSLYHASRANLPAAWAILEELLSIAGQEEKEHELIDGYRARGYLQLTRGRLSNALEDLERSLEIYHRLKPELSTRMSSGIHPLWTALNWKSIALALQGQPVQALSVVDAAIEDAQKQSQIHLAGLLGWGLVSRILWLDARSVQELVSTLIEVATENHLAYPGMLGLIYHGWAQTVLGSSNQGLSEMELGFGQLRSSGTVGTLTLFLTLMVQAYQAADRIKEATTLCKEALELAHRTDERWCEAELYRLQGELLARQDVSRTEEIAGCFHRATEVAARQGARLWKLKALLSHAQFQRDSGQIETAAEELAAFSRSFPRFENALLQRISEFLGPVDSPS